MLSEPKRNTKVLGLVLMLTMNMLSGHCALAQESTEQADDRLDKILHRLQEASENTSTLSADFVYTVTSAKQQQLVLAKVRLKKPNYARITYSYMAQPAFPSLVASDGNEVYTFTPSSFQPNRTFAPGPFDSVLGAKQASGLAPDGGKFKAFPSEADGKDLLLWDAAPIQAFFNPTWAIRRQLYAHDLSELVAEDPVEIEGTTYDVLYHRYLAGNIAGGEQSSFHQRLYIAPDGLIHMYILEFQSAGAGGTQVARLKNVKINEEMSEDSFLFTPPNESSSDEEEKP